MTETPGSVLSIPATPHAAYAQVAKSLRDGAVAAAEAEAKQLVETVVGKALYLADELNQSQRQGLAQMLRRRLNGEPLQHVLGYQYFYGLRLRAHPGVFCTRPETELLVSHALDWLRQLPNPTRKLQVLDLCTGSGAIALAIASQCPAASLTAVELSETAYHSARANARDLGLTVDFVLADATELQPRWLGRFDLVVSNPPYIPTRDLEPQTLHDPAVALWGGGEDGMILPAQIISVSSKYLRPNATLLMEHDDTQGKLCRDAARRAGLIAPQTHRDLNGRDRYLQASRPPGRNHRDAVERPGRRAGADTDAAEGD